MTNHTLGYKGNRTFLPHELKALEQVNVHIHHLGNDRYQLGAAEGTVDLDALCPSFISHEDGVFDHTNLTKFMDWLNQPSAAFYAHKTGQKQNAKQNKTARQSMLRFMNFALTGQAELQDKKRDFLEKETAECHAETEDSIRKNDEWMTENEFGNSEIFSSSLPNTSINPAQGFILNPSDVFHTAQDGYNQQAAQQLFKNIVQTATKGRNTGSESSITLNARELEQFFILADHVDLKTLVDKVHFETAVQDKAKKIKDRARHHVQAQASQQIQTSSDRQKLNDLLQATSAFTPIMQSQYLENAWWRSHITESWFADNKETPYSEIAEEYAVLNVLMQAYYEQDNVSPTLVQAITEEFYPLLVTTEKAQEILESAAQKAKTPLPAGVSAFKQAFDNARSVHFPVAEKFLPENHQEVLENLEHTLKSGPKAFLQSLTTDPVKGGIEAGWDVTKDVWNYMTESPKQAMIVVAGGTVLYMLSSNTGVDATTLSANNDILIFTAEGFVSAPAPKDLIAEAAQSQSYHYDVGFSLKESIKSFFQGDLTSPYYVYKHFTNYMMVEGTEISMEKFENAMQYVAKEMGLEGNPNTALSSGAKTTMYSLAAFYFGLNLFQNFSHTGFWKWCAEKGFSHGGKGSLQIVELAGPLINPIHQAGLNLAELTPLKKKIGLAERLSLMTQGQDDSFEYKGHLDLETGNFDITQGAQRIKPVIALAEAAIARQSLENTLPENIREAQFNLKIGGIDLPFGKEKAGSLSREFTVSAQNLKPTLEALEKFDHALENMAAQIGADEPWYNIYLKQKIENVTTALSSYQQNGDLHALQTTLQQNMLDVMAAQIRLSNGHSEIWNAITVHDLDAKAQKRLHRLGNTSYGELKRADKLDELRREKMLKNKAMTEHLVTSAKIDGVRLWDDIVSASRKLQNLDNIIPVMPTAVATLGTAATCVVLDQFGMGNAVTDLGAQATGIAASSTVMTGIFVGYNWFIDDVIFVHLGTGAGLMGGAIAARMGYNQIKPIVATAAENETLSSIANSAYQAVKPLATPITYPAAKLASWFKKSYQKAHKKNAEFGSRITQRYWDENKDLYHQLTRLPEDSQPPMLDQA